MSRTSVFANQLSIVAALTLCAVPARAQVTAAGPYYAVPSWDQTLPASSRFVILSNFGNGAVLDRETGLTWAQSTSTFGDYLSATKTCQNLAIGNRLGWRLPAVQELMSLIDPSVTGPVKLPVGHPFTLGLLNPTTKEFWTLTPFANMDRNVWVVDLAPVFSILGYVTNVDIVTSPVQYNIWCVRGPQTVGVE